MKNRRPIRLSLQVKLALTAVAGIICLAAALVYYYGRELARTADGALDRRAQAIVTGLANECEYGLLVGNKSLLQQAASKALVHADVVSVVVFDDAGRLVAAAGQTDVAAKTKLGPTLLASYQGTDAIEVDLSNSQPVDTFYRAVYLQPAATATEFELDEELAEPDQHAGQKLGLVELVISHATTDLAVARARRATLLSAGLLAAALATVCVLVVRRMIQPLRALAFTTEQLAQGNLQVRVTGAGTDEIGDLAHAFNGLAESLQRSQQEVLGHQRLLEQRVRERTSELEKEIAERRQTEETLAKERNRLRTLIDNSPDLIYVKDTAGRFMVANMAAARVMGAAAPEYLLGRTDADFFPADLVEQYQASEQRVLVQGEVLLDHEEPVVTAAGEHRCHSTTKVPLRDATGATIGLVGLGRDITARKQAESELERLHRELLDTSRQAGMAEVATNVLHNVGNVLNSVNVSAVLVAERVRKSEAANLSRLAALIREHQDHLAEFLTTDPKGQRVPGYLLKLIAHLDDERGAVLNELQSLTTNIEHIKEIVAMQQSYSKVAGVVEALPVADLIEDALRMNTAALVRHQVQVFRQFASVPPVRAERHKVLQILVNLIRNAKYALDEGGKSDKQLILRVSRTDHLVQVAVIDNGIGIAPEIMSRIFEHGFTTRRDGHGFGLHSGALAAKEMGGSLAAHSDGPGQGATFLLTLPVAPEGEQP